MTATIETAQGSIIEQLEILYADREELFNAFGVTSVEGVVAVIRNLEDQLLTIYAEGEEVPAAKKLPEGYTGENLWIATDSVFDDLAAVSAEVADKLNFGFIRMDDEGVVEIYNTWEMELADMHRSAVVNRNFFKDIAPCTHNRIFYHSLLSSVQNGEALDKRMKYTFTYRITPTPVDIRMVRDAERHKFYMLIKRA